MLNTALDLLTYGGGIVFAGVCLFAGIFLAAAAYYFITDLIGRIN